jgi:hypothetical protein
MAKKNKAVQALEGAAVLNEVQTIVRRLIEDEELRDNVRHAIDSSRTVVDRVTSAKKPSKLLEDKKLQSEAIEALAAIRAVTVSLTGLGKSLPDPKKLTGRTKKKGGAGRFVLLIGAGGAAAVAASENLRSKVLDALFGAEEEFEYSPPPPPPAAADASDSPLSAV